MCEPRLQRGHLLGGTRFSQKTSSEEGEKRGPALARILYLVPPLAAILETLMQEYFQHDYLVYRVSLLFCIMRA